MVVNSHDSSSASSRVVLYLLLAGLAMVVVRTAWVCDDAYITFRTVWNWAHGYGLTWNPSERVQAFTHPLWMLVMAAAYPFTHDVYYTSIFLSLGATLGAALLLLRLRGSFVAGVSCMLVLILSTAFVDYATSGLENALSYGLVALFLVVLFAGYSSVRSLTILTLIGSLLVLNRLDLILLVGPALVWAFLRMRGWPAAAAVALGSVPLAAWEVFALVYYGFPFPNTYYAKLHTGIAGGELWAQGIKYAVDIAGRDPLTAVVIVAGTVVGLLSREWRRQALAVGIVLYLLYVVRIGGDFMAGRFFAVPLVAAVGILVQQRCAWRRGLAAVPAVMVVGLGFIVEQPTILSGESFGKPYRDALTKAKIADERAVYFPETGLLRAHWAGRPIRHEAWGNGLEAAKEGVAVVARGHVGFYGFAAGPNVHIIDLYALADPLLARMPMTDRTNWRIGHYYRQEPAGYTESIRQRKNLLANEALAEFYGRLTLVTQGETWSLRRWREIVRLNLGEGMVDMSRVRPGTT